MFLPQCEFIFLRKDHHHSGVLVKSSLKHKEEPLSGYIFPQSAAVGCESSSCFDSFFDNQDLISITFE